jgi:hypothetical protein
LSVLRFVLLLAEDEPEETTQRDLVNIYGQSNEIMAPVSTDELQHSSSANKRLCVNDVLSEIEQNVSCANEMADSIEKADNVNTENKVEPRHVTTSSPRRVNKENSVITCETLSDGDKCESNSLKSPARRKNVFAISSNAGLRPRFSLNESKTNKNEIDSFVEVKSRQV